LDEYVLDLLDSVSADTGRRFDLSGVVRLSRPDFKADVADAVEVFLVPGRQRRDDTILSLSPPAFPEAVAAAVARTEALARRLPDALANTVLLPEHRGSYSGRSFVLYRRLHAVSENRVLGYLQKRALRAPVMQWLGDLAQASRCKLSDRAEIHRRFLDPLGKLSEEQGASDALREAARAAAEAIAGGEVQPVTIIQHGDFWLGNILLHSAWPRWQTGRYPFTIIDWGTVNVDGYPVVDLMRFLNLTTRDPGVRTAMLNAYLAATGLEREAALPHLCTGIAWLGMHRNQFPLSRYLESSERLFQGTRKALG